MMSDEENKDGGGLGFVNGDDAAKKSQEDSDDSDEEYDNQVSRFILYNIFNSLNLLSQLSNSKVLFSKRMSLRCSAMLSL